MGTFSKHIVNKRFKELYYALLDRGIIKGKSDIAHTIGTYNHIINRILKGERNITVDMILALSDHYQINTNYLFGLEDQMIFSTSIIDGESIPTDEKKGNILLVPENAFGGYIIGYKDPEADAAYQRMDIPQVQGEHFAFEVVGDSMNPTVMQGDIVVTAPVEQLSDVKDNRVYVVVGDGIVIKRLQKVKSGNRVSKLKHISDNHSIYKPYEISTRSIKQILEVKYRITNFGIK